MPHLAFLVAIVPLYNLLGDRLTCGCISDYTHSGQATSAALILKTAKSLNFQLFSGHLRLHVVPPHTPFQAGATSYQIGEDCHAESPPTDIPHLDGSALVACLPPMARSTQLLSQHSSGTLPHATQEKTAPKDFPPQLPFSDSSARHALPPPQLISGSVESQIRTQIYYVTELF